MDKKVLKPASQASLCSPAVSLSTVGASVRRGEELPRQCSLKVEPERPNR